MVNENVISESESATISSMDQKLDTVARDKSDLEIELYVQLEEVFPDMSLSLTFVS